MPPRRRYPSRPRGGLARRRLVWAEFDAVASFTANGQWFCLDLLQAYKAVVGSTISKCTVARTHGYVAHTTGAAAAGDRVWSGFRVADVNDTSGTLTTAATVANPRDNPYVDWAFASRHSVDGAAFLTPGQIGQGAGGNSQSSIVYDLKSRRKLENLTDTWAFVLMQDNVTTVASTWHVYFKTLLMRKKMSLAYSCNV